MIAFERPKQSEFEHRQKIGMLLFSSAKRRHELFTKKYAMLAHHRDADRLR